MIMRTTSWWAVAIGLLSFLLRSNTLAFSHPSSTSFRYRHYTATGIITNNRKNLQQKKQDQQQQRGGGRRFGTTTSRFAGSRNNSYSQYGSSNPYGQQQYGKGQQARPPPNSIPPPKPVGDFDYAVGILGDLHMDPRILDEYIIGRDQLYDALMLHVGAQHALVSLGDLGETKPCGHNPNNPQELYSGTTQCHELAAEYLQSFQLPYEVITGNHDLEGIDEFATDAENLATFLRLHDKPAPQFVREIAPATLLVGLSTTVFRDAEYTSHEVVIDDAQIAWFEDLLATHPDHRIFVFTHAPPSGSGLRVLQENHVVNGCCWLNQSSNHGVFINLVRRYPTIKAWFSGHFHLGHDYQDSITFPVNANRGSCVFCQVSVMRQGSSRDGRRQSRLLRGNDKGFEICTIDHNDPNGNIRVDTTILYETAEEGMAIYAHEDRIGGGRNNNNTTNGSSSAFAHEKYFKVYQPFPGDDTNPPDQYLLNFEGSFVLQEPVTLESIHWWYLACGRILGIHQGILLEYDASTMAPMGLVVGSDELLGKRVAVIDSGLPSNAGVTGCVVSDDVGMEGADCVKASELREQAVVLIDDKDNSFLVVQPNEDGSYWRKIVRNKMIRMKELRREKAAKELAKTLFDKEASRVVSSWGPYVTTSSWARKTGVEGLTSTTTARRGQ